MDNFKNLEDLQKQLDKLQEKFSEYTELLETNNDLSSSYRKKIESQINRTSCDMQNAKENIDQIRILMKDGFIAQFIKLVDQMVNEINSTSQSGLILGFVTGTINPFKKISNFLKQNNVGEYFTDVIDFTMSLLTGLVRYIQSNNGTMDDLKINISGGIELFDRFVIKDEFGMSKQETEMDGITALIVSGRYLIIDALAQFGYNPEDRLLDLFLKYDRMGMRTEIGKNIMETYQNSGNVHLSKILKKFIKELQKLKKEEEKKNKKDDERHDVNDDDDNDNWGTEGHNDDNSDSENDDHDGDDDGVTNISFCFFGGCGIGSDPTKNNKRHRDDDDDDDDDDNNKRRKN